jgi:hypothetical protein
MAIMQTDIPEAATLPDCVRDHLPALSSCWIVDGHRVFVLIWSAAEWAAIPDEDRPLDARPRGDIMVLLVLAGRSWPAT